MTDQLRFDGRVAIITGAGNGLGRSHAHLLASRGAKVVVNDLGGSAHGTGQSTSAADKVVAEIKEKGGEAVANYNSVEDGSKIVQTALDAWGRVDIVINNAGILRDVSFPKMTQDDWDLIYKVHVLGAFRVTHAAWPHMRDAGYGRIVFTASAAGIYGNFGQANYSMAKLGLVGLSSTLAIEGRKKNVRVNTIAPIAGSRMTETVLPKELIDALKPEFVSPLVAWLCHEACEDTGGLYEVGGGFYSKLRWERTVGKAFKLGREITPESVRSNWTAISDFEHVTHPSDITSSMEPVLANLQSKSKGGNEWIDVDAALGAELPETRSRYDERDLSIYALGVGAAADPLDQKELRYVYDLHSEGFQPLPTFAVVPAINALLDLGRQGKQAPGLNYGLDRLLHGEQYTELKRPLAPHASLTHKSRIKDIFDKGKHAVVVTETHSFDESGREVIHNEFSAVIRGAGGWGGDRGPTADANVVPDRAPDATESERINSNQALLYRLSGDFNPLHADPNFARAFGFARPILHGLCTFGYAGRAVVKHFLDGDARRFKSIRVRFADPVFPGETLVTEMWKASPTRVLFRCKAKERDKVVIANAVVEFWETVPTETDQAPASTSAAAAPAAPAGAASASAATSSQSGDVFIAIGDYIAKNPDLVGQVATTFLFKLTSPDSAYVIDVKNGKGGVKPGVGAADVTLELSDADFLAMTSGAADPQKLYFAGKLKIAGNLMASQKLTFLKKIDPESAKAAVAKAKASGAAPAPAEAGSTAGKSAHAPALFKALGERLASNAGLAAEIKACIQFKLKDPDDAWVVDAASKPPAVTRGTRGDAKTTITLADEDLVELAKGANVRDLFQHGKLRVDGDVRPAHALTFFKGLA